MALSIFGTVRSVIDDDVQWIIQKRKHMLGSVILCFHQTNVDAFEMYNILVILFVIKDETYILCKEDGNTYTVHNLLTITTNISIIT